MVLFQYLLIPLQDTFHLLDNTLPSSVKECLGRLGKRGFERVCCPNFPASIQDFQEQLGFSYRWVLDMKMGFHLMDKLECLVYMECTHLVHRCVPGRVTSHTAHCPGTHYSPGLTDRTGT